MLALQVKVPSVEEVMGSWDEEFQIWVAHVEQWFLEATAIRYTEMTAAALVSSILCTVKNIAFFMLLLFSPDQKDVVVVTFSASGGCSNENYMCSSRTD